jgi:hypothetical protein
LDLKPKKRIFIGLLVFTCLILFLLIFLLWYVPMVGLKNIHSSLPFVFTIILAILVLLMLSGGLLLVFTIFRKDVFLSHGGESTKCYSLRS